MTALLDDTRRTALRAFCDTIVPQHRARADDPDGFWARKASDLGIDPVAEELISAIPDRGIRGGLLRAARRARRAGPRAPPSQLSREQILRNIRLASPQAAAGHRRARAT